MCTNFPLKEFVFICKHLLINFTTSSTLDFVRTFAIFVLLEAF